MKIQIIINPISGTKSAQKRVAKAVKAIEQAFNITAVKTQCAGHATQLAKQAIEEGADVVVAVGGDGTVNEIASALKHTQTALMIEVCTGYLLSKLLSE